MKKLIVVIPVYRKLEDIEKKIIHNNKDMLNDYEFSFVVPEGMDILELEREFPEIRLVKVSNRWLGPNLGVKGYNEMMMSKAFYQLFSSYEYMLICHFDAWIFKDNMEEWLSKQYDIVAAPWIFRPHSWPNIEWKILREGNIFSKIFIKCFPNCINIEYRDYSIGNGGFSLRKISSVIAICDEEKKLIENYIKQSEGAYNEDVFWSQFQGRLKYPSLNEALSFAIDAHPWLCLQINKNNLPMACHGFYKRRSRRSLWKKYIHIL